MAFPPIAASTASSGDFPTVTLDADSVQKFAEIEVQWGESLGEGYRPPPFPPPRTSRQVTWLHCGPGMNSSPCPVGNMCRTHERALRDPEAAP